MSNNKRTNVTEEAVLTVVDYFNTHHNNTSRDISENTGIPQNRVIYILRKHFDLTKKI